MGNAHQSGPLYLAQWRLSILRVASRMACPSSTQALSVPRFPSESSTAAPFAEPRDPVMGSRQSVSQIEIVMGVAPRQKATPSLFRTAVASGHAIQPTMLPL